MKYYFLFEEAKMEYNKSPRVSHLVQGVQR